MNGILINGKWTKDAPDGVLRSISPETGSVLAEFPMCGSTQIDQAVAAARAASAAWRGLSLSARCGFLLAFAEQLTAAYGSEGEATQLKALICDEVGKRLPEADIEVAESADMVRYFANGAEAVLSDVTLPLDSTLWPTKLSKAVAEPHGVVAVIKAWNYPLEIPIWAIAPALVAGNSVVFKPSEHSPLVGTAIGALFEKAGLPPGVLNIVTGDKGTGELLSRHPGIDMVSFTGSVRAGRLIAKAAAERLLPTSMELGGNDAALVLDDADLELAANGLVWGAVCNSGQVCVGVKRIIAVDGIYDRLVEMLEARISGLQPGVDYGPIISTDQLASVQRFVSDAVSKGATLVIGGENDADSGPQYLTPALLSDVPASADLATEECFGPVAPLFRAKDETDAVRIANDSDYGLGASIWTSSRERFERVASALTVGMVWENDVNVAFPQAPWGGRKLSGNGCDLSEWGLREYVAPKHLSMEQGDDKSRPWWYPYGT